MTEKNVDTELWNRTWQLDADLSSVKSDMSAIGARMDGVEAGVREMTAAFGQFRQEWHNSRRPEWGNITGAIGVVMVLVGAVLAPLYARMAVVEEMASEAIVDRHRVELQQVRDHADLRVRTANIEGKIASMEKLHDHQD